MWGKHHRPNMDFDNMTEEQVVDFVNMITAVLMIFGFMYVTFWVCLFQGIFFCQIKKLMINQDKLEKAFMGGNQAQVAVARPQQVLQA